ncbi:hypothetical protein GB404_03450 [Salmonella enterica]|nr:hypothetical protein [Salmonella enterica]
MIFVFLNQLNQLNQPPKASITETEKTLEKKMLSASDIERQAANTAAYWMERAMGLREIAEAEEVTTINVRTGEQTA